MMYYTWQVHLWLDSLRDRHSDKCYCALFVPKGRTQNTKWDQIISYILRRNLTFILMMM
jgi:hypothetical protein